MVTAFFRDHTAWEYIANETIPRLLSRKRPYEPIRIWSAGCASGEEIYTIAIILAEALGSDQFRERVKIYATDLDEDALARARHASFSAKETAGVPPELLDKYFERTDGCYVFQKELRRSIIFGRHDLIQDAPISRIDLLICRNVMMYFNSETQARILARFHFGLNPDAFLFLGRAEMLFTHTSTFTPVDLKRRVFAKLPRTDMRDGLLLMGQSQREDGLSAITNHVRIRESAYDAVQIAQIAIDQYGALVLVNERA